MNGSRRGRRAQAGVTLVELMIAITLDLVIVAAVAGLYVKNSEYRNQIERSGQQIENGRYAMQVLADDLQQAGYFAELDVRSAVSPAGAIAWAFDNQSHFDDPLPDPCANKAAGTAPFDLRDAVPVHVQAFNSANAPSCIDDIKPLTDIIVVRRAASCVAGPAANPNCPIVAGSPYFQASACNSATELGGPYVANQFRVLRATGSLNRTQRDCVTPAPWHQYLVRIYFVANNDAAGDGIPTLKRAELTGAGFQTVSIANGIQDMQLEYGLDNVGADGVPDVWAKDPLNGCGTNTTCQRTATLDIMQVKVNLLARSLATRRGYQDGKTYTLGVDVNGNPLTRGPFYDSYERHAFTSSVRLINAAIRRQ